MDGSSKGTTYRIFKHNIMLEPYLKLLPESLSFPILNFRLSNHKLHVETGRWESIILDDRKCLLRQSESIGNEFQYLFECSFFETSRQKYLPAYYIIRLNTYKLDLLLNSTHYTLLKNLSIFIKIVLKSFQ